MVQKKKIKEQNLNQQTLLSKFTSLFSLPMIMLPLPSLQPKPILSSESLFAPYSLLFLISLFILSFHWIYFAAMQCLKLRFNEIQSNQSCEQKNLLVYTIGIVLVYTFLYIQNDFRNFMPDIIFVSCKPNCSKLTSLIGLYEVSSICLIVCFSYHRVD